MHIYIYLFIYKFHQEFQHSHCEFLDFFWQLFYSPAFQGLSINSVKKEGSKEGRNEEEKEGVH